MTYLARLAEEIAFVVKAARPGFWLTSIWFYLVPVGGEMSSMTQRSGSVSSM